MTEINRRTLLTGMAALGATAAVSGGKVMANETRVPVIDVHTHMFSEKWMEVARRSNDHDFKLADDGRLLYKGGGIGTIVPKMLDYKMRLDAMDKAGVDMALISLTSPNVYWGTKEQSIQAARNANDDFKMNSEKTDGRVRWMASLPWQYPAEALEELKRVKANGAVGIVTLTNIKGMPLTHEMFKPIWREIEAMQLPTFIHPTSSYVPYIEKEEGETNYGLFNSIGWTNETSLCFARMITHGFFDEFKKLNLIASHGGGTLPYVIGRMDQIWKRATPEGIMTPEPPSSYIRRIHFDSIVFDDNTLDHLIKQVGVDRILYGSDFPFQIGDMEGNLARVNKRPVAERNAIKSSNLLKLYDL